jgi:hypothetical protein
MLQQGKFVADVIYYYGEDNNITALFGDKLPGIPEGYNYDFVNSDALLNLLSVEKGNIVTPSGMKYRLLVLDPNSMHMPLPVLLKIRNLAEQGALVLGPRPLDSPSLSDDQAQFRSIVNFLWPEGTDVKIVGKGKIYSSKTVEAVLTENNISPDFEFKKSDEKTSLLFVHRHLPEADIYWVNNRNDRNEDVEASFRINGKEAEAWHPETGLKEPISYEISNGHTKVQLHLVPNDAVFVVFRKKAGASSRIIPQPVEKLVSAIRGPWDLTFQPDRGAPAKIALDTLESWSNNPDPGIKYFSGTGTYTTNVDAPDNWFNTGNELWLDLGEVKNLAEVLVNGKSLGIVWKKPFRVNASEALEPGANRLEVKVTNLWVNRLIGDQQPGITKKITYTTQAFYKADSPLLPSGLLGPVKIVSLSVK